MKSKEKLRTGLIISGMAIIVAVVIILYAVFMQTMIFRESASHLSEIYGQTNAQLQQRIESHRSIMRSWESYILETTDPDDPEGQAEFERFIDAQKKALNVKRFSFINLDNMTLPDDDENKDKILAKDRDGREYQLELRRPAKELFQGDNPSVACMRTYQEGTGIEVKDEDGNILAPVGEARKDYNPNDRYIMVAVRYAGLYNYYTAPGEDPVKDPTRKFHYNGIAFFFDVEAISYTITVDAFQGKASCFLVLPSGINDDSTGLVLLQSGTDPMFQTKEGEQLNFLKFLENNTKMKYSAVRNLQNKWQQKPETPETVSFRAKNGTEYYLNYRMVGFNDWILVGVVPAKIINKNMTSLRAITILVMAVIFVVVGAGIAWFIIMADKRKMHDQAVVLKSRESLFDLLTMNSNDIFALFNAKTGEAEYVSPNVTSILGFDFDTVKKDVYTLMQAATVPVEGFTKEAVYADEDGVVIDELPMRNIKDQTEYWFRLGVNPSPHSDKLFIFMLSDRTKDRKMRTDLEAALNIAKTANEAKSNFLSNMSHDIRTPMNAIIGFTTLLEKDVENPAKAREYIRKISHSSHHLLSLINDILDMSKIESGKSALHVAEFSLPEMLEELYSIIISQVNAKQQKFEMRTKGTLPEMVYGDKLRLNQVMINLLSNAVKYTQVGGEITLSVEALPEAVRNHAHLRLSVKDNGLGMSEDFVRVIFEPFSRETTEAKREIQGTGLGMAITKQIVDLMGGTITVKSKRGEGSEFIVEIELAKVMQTDKDPTAFWKRHNIQKMLVVDDDEDVCIEVKELMSDTGVMVDYTTGWQGAIEKVTAMKDGKTKYDIVLLDWKMPEMDGVEVAKRIREIVDPELPIMILTSYNFEEIEDEAKDTGIHAFLSKPFFVSNFRHAVEELQKGNQVEEEEEESVEEASLEGLNILAAEDNPINAEILNELLDIEGATCTIAENGKIALETFEQSAPGTFDMIFMDVQMPVMNGHEASKAIRQCSHPEAKTIPIIAMTANAFDDDKKMAYDAGMNAHVAKPIDMAIVKKTVAKLLAEKKEG